uniref:Zinc finger protein RFP-like n=1 Tax=Podarcis muralis TaxID=64176 RepID=A0A670HNY6_PODMU
MAVSGGPVQSLCDEATCSICLEYFKDPVTIPECGHNFCRSCLVQCWGKLEAEASCPQCRITVQPRSLISNRQLANAVEIAKKLSLPLQEGKVCEKHQETLKLFCKVDATLICVVCDRSKEHENHKVIPLEEASEEYKTKNSQEEKTSDSASLLFPTANVTLNPDTAHPKLILSEDRKSVRWGDKKQALPDNPERFNDWPSVLGREGFTAGRHFWEVTVGSEGEWAVGVARKSLRRKDDFLMRIINTFCDYEEGIWAVGKLRGKYTACTSPDSSPLSLSEEPRRIRVTLDCEAGEISFTGADSGAELYTFSGASFSGETFLPFFYLRGDKIHLRIS